MRRSSRRRGSVSPPAQRLTVLTETPIWRAAASWDRPSRLSTPASHWAKERYSGRSRGPLGEDPEADLDLAAVRAGRVQQGRQHGVVELLAAHGGQRGVAQVAQDELADVGD